MISVWDVVGVSVGRPFGGGLFETEERTEGRRKVGSKASASGRRPFISGRVEFSAEVIGEQVPCSSFSFPRGEQ